MQDPSIKSKAPTCISDAGGGYPVRPPRILGDSGRSQGDLADGEFLGGVVAMTILRLDIVRGSDIQGVESNARTYTVSDCSDLVSHKAATPPSLWAYLAVCCLLESSGWAGGRKYPIQDDEVLQRKLEELVRKV